MDGLSKLSGGTFEPEDEHFIEVSLAADNSKTPEIGGTDLAALSGKASLLNGPEFAAPALGTVLEQTPMFLAVLMDQLPDPVYFKDRNSRFVLASKALTQGVFLLSDPTQVAGRTDFDFYSEKIARRFYEKEQAIMSTGEPMIDVEEKETMPDGRVLWFLTSKFPLKDQAGLITGLFGISRDISERKRTEEELKTSEEKLRHSQKMEAFGQLAGGIAHDFNNMLGVILGASQLVEMQLRDAAPEMKRNVNMLIDSAKRAADLTQQLLAFARKDNYKVVSLDMNEVIRSVIGLLRHTIDKKIRIVERLGASPATIMGDFMQLQNALLNLALNARDAMPEGGVLTFTTEVAGPGREAGNPENFGSYLRIRVADTGCGMDEKTKIRIFEPFFTTKGPRKGTGLGLASVYGTVKNHNGLIEVESEIGVGTVFTVYVPLTKEKEKRMDEERLQNKKGSGRVLVVDDEEDLLTIVAELLESLGYSPVTRHSGIEGIEYYKNHHAEIDLIIVDMIMPRMSGYDCVKIFKRINPQARILVSSGYSLVSDTQQIISKGIAGFIQKPFNVSELSQAIFLALQK